ncbi:hypothetical protein BDN72DRAFT_882622 [Pluteus cervinus]|uniref:Uncharacterized protein n=1 Tax=Pluteus cervinus TaxID=181527 RepID=A0ACD3A9X5_9AGAR|nr:hypothetical protein BDN72DRAFT_882622 [Pluteus cervinus]
MTMSTTDLSGLTNAQAFAKIDSEISYLESRLQILRGLRNTLPPVASLPTEILSKIFLICHNLDIEPDSNGTLHWTSNQQGQVRLTLSWVSRRWRITAISYPELWTFVTKGSLEYLQVCLARSKGLNMAVVLRGPQESYIQECLMVLPRIRSLYIDPSLSERDHLSLGGFWLRQAPFLVSLSATSLDIEGTPEGVPLFSSVHPQLQHLSLSKSRFQWDSPLLAMATLTTLHIIKPVTLTTIHALVEKLRKMTSLRDCQFVSCFREVEPPPHAQIHQRIVLPSLQNLTLQHRPLFVPFAFLSYLEIPNSSILLQSEVGRPLSADFRYNFQCLREYWSHTPYWKEEEFRHIAINSHIRPKFNISISTSASRISTQGAPRCFTMELSSHISVPFHSFSQSIMTLPANFQCVSLNGQRISRDGVYLISQFTNPRVLRLLDVGELDELKESLARNEFGQEVSSWDIGLDQALPQLEVLQVGGQSYRSFEEFRRLTA